MRLILSVFCETDIIPKMFSLGRMILFKNKQFLPQSPFFIYPYPFQVKLQTQSKLTKKSFQFANC